MSEQHPDTQTVNRLFMLEGSEEDRIIAAYREGADAQLDACAEWLGDAPVIWEGDPEAHPGHHLRLAMRPKTPSQAELALEALNSSGFQPGTVFRRIDPPSCTTIRAALERLRELEGQS